MNYSMPIQKRVKIQIGDHELENVDCTKFLGVITHQHLSWKKQINDIANNISKTIGIICKVWYYLNASVLITIYNSLIYPYLFYGNIVWANNPSRINVIYKMQKKALRIITSPYNEHSAPLFQKLKLLNLYQINDLVISIFMFDFRKCNLPNYFDDCFTLNKQVHDYNTRNSRSINKQYIRTDYGKLSIRTKGTDLWNSIPCRIKESYTQAQFKRKMKLQLRHPEIGLLFWNKSLSVECLCCYISDCKATGRFHTKTWIKFILIRMYKKIATFIEYLDKLAQSKTTRTSELQEKNAIHDSEQLSRP